MRSPGLTLGCGIASMYGIQRAIVGGVHPALNLPLGDKDNDERR